MISIDDVVAARERVAGVLRRTPLEVSDSLSRLAGRRVLLKPEHLQRTGSFKIRGAYNLISQLDAGVAVVAASAGNHAQGVALAAALTGRAATIFMPANAPLPKVDATRAYGATVRLEGDTVDDCLVTAKAFAGEHGSVFVPPFDDPAIVAGQGTIGLELAEEAQDDLDVVVVPVGGGGLVSGIAVALAAMRPGVRVVGVEAEGAAAMSRSVTEGECVTLDHVATMADGIALKAACSLTFEHVRELVDDVVTVTEEEISRAVLLLLERAKAVVEPAGAVGLAAVLAGRVGGPAGAPAAVVLSGGNVDPLLLMKLIDHGLSAAGRYLILRIVIGDRPGALAGLTSAVADLGLNVLEVEHHRSGMTLGIGEVEVLLTLETRDPDHREQTVAALRRRGYQVVLVR
ncbi:MAG TPA: threonine ammonia-lyase [Acidimicrobiales bacterium]